MAVLLTIWNFNASLDPNYPPAQIKGYTLEQFIIEDSFWTAFYTNVIKNQKNHGIKIPSLIKVCKTPLPQDPVDYSVNVLQDFFIDPSPSSLLNRNVNLQDLLNEIEQLINYFDGLMYTNGLNLTSQNLAWVNFEANAKLDAIERPISDFLSLGMVKNDSDMQTLIVLYAFKFCIKRFNVHYSELSNQYNIILHR